MWLVNNKANAATGNKAFSAFQRAAVRCEAVSGICHNSPSSSLAEHCSKPDRVSPVIEERID